MTTIKSILFGILTMDIDMDDLYCNGNTSCAALICPHGFIKERDNENFVCSKCKMNTYSLKPNAVKCKPCPLGAYCPGGSTVYPRQGYWQPENYKELEASLQVFRE